LIQLLKYRLVISPLYIPLVLGFKLVSVIMQLLASDF